MAFWQAFFFAELWPPNDFAPGSVWAWKDSSERIFWNTKTNRRFNGEETVISLTTVVSTVEDMVTRAWGGSSVWSLQKYEDLNFKSPAHSQSRATAVKVCNYSSDGESWEELFYPKSKLQVQWDILSKKKKREKLRKISQHQFLTLLSHSDKCIHTHTIIIIGRVGKERRSLWDVTAKSHYTELKWPLTVNPVWHTTVLISDVKEQLQCSGELLRGN